jgi:hypothetical protein
MRGSSDDLPKINVDECPEGPGGDERVQQEVVTRELPVFVGGRVSFFKLSSDNSYFLSIMQTVVAEALT